MLQNQLRFTQSSKTIFCSTLLSKFDLIFGKKNLANLTKQCLRYDNYREMFLLKTFEQVFEKHFG